MEVKDAVDTILWQSSFFWINNNTDYSECVVIQRRWTEQEREAMRSILFSTLERRVVNYVDKFGGESRKMGLRWGRMIFEVDAFTMEVIIAEDFGTPIKFSLADRMSLSLMQDFVDRIIGCVPEDQYKYINVAPEPMGKSIGGPVLPTHFIERMNDAAEDSVGELVESIEEEIDRVTEEALKKLDSWRKNPIE